MNMAFNWGATRENYEIFHFMTTSVMPQILESWQLFHNMLLMFSKNVGYLEQI